MREGDDSPHARIARRIKQRKIFAATQAANTQIRKTKIGTPMTAYARTTSDNDFKYNPRSAALTQIVGTAFPDLKIVKPHSFANWLELYIQKEYNSRLRAYGYDEYKNEIQIKSSGSKQDAYQALAAVEAGFLKLERRPVAWQFPRKLRSKFVSTGPKMENTFNIDSIEPQEFMQWLDRTEIKSNEYQLFNRYDDDISVVFLRDEHATVFKMTFAGDM